MFPYCKRTDSRYEDLNIVAIVTSSTLVELPAVASASCSSFSSTANYSTWYPSSQAYRVSPGFTCTSGQSYGPSYDWQADFCNAPNCSIRPYSEDMTITGITNLSLSAADTQSLFSRLKNTFAYSVSGNFTSDGAWCLPVGKSVNITVTPVFQRLFFRLFERLSGW